MVLKPDTKIKLLENIKACPWQYRKTLPSFQDKHAVTIPKYEVVTVVDRVKSNLRVKNILDEEFLIPDVALFKIVGKSKSSVAVKADLLDDLAGLGIELGKHGGNSAGSKKSDEIPKGNKVRAVQKMQTIVSNVMSTEDISSLSKLTVAALCANMSINSGVDTIQSNKLQAYCTKLIGSVNS